MYRDDFDKARFESRDGDDVYSKPVRAGKRTYFFDVKSTKDNKDFYMTITESKRRTNPDGSFAYDKHKIFLYKEDFEKFRDGLDEVISYISKRAPQTEYSERKSQDDQNGRFTDVEFEEL